MIPWSQNFHFVTTVALTRRGVMYPRVRDFLLIVFLFISFHYYYNYQTRGKPADTQIYLEAALLQDPGQRPIW